MTFEGLVRASLNAQSGTTEISWTTTAKGSIICIYRIASSENEVTYLYALEGNELIEIIH